MNRSWRMPIVGMTLLVAVVLAASTAAGQEPALLLQVVTADARDTLVVVAGAVVDVQSGGRMLARKVTSASGMCSVPVKAAGIPSDIRISKAGCEAVSLKTTYHTTDGGFFVVGAAAGLAVTEKIAPGVYYMVALPPAGAGAAPAPGGQAMKLFFVDAVRRDAAGTPVPLAGVAIAISQAGRSVASGTSAADGSYRSPPLAAGDYVVRVSLAGYKALSTIMKMPGHATGSVLALGPRAAGGPVAQTALTVRVHELRAAGPPHSALAGAEVFVHQKGRLAAGGVSDAQGSSRFPLSAGDYQVTVRKAGYVPQTVSARVGTGSHHTDVYLPKDAGAVVPKYVKLTVRVMQPPALAPVSGARVEVRRAGSTKFANTTTNAQGQCVFDLASNTTVQLVVTKAGYAVATVTVTVPASDVVRLVILQPSGPR